jgi:hypothetical protein
MQRSAPRQQLPDVRDAHRRPLRELKLAGAAPARRRRTRRGRRRRVRVRALLGARTSGGAAFLCIQHKARVRPVERVHGARCALCHVRLPVHRIVVSVREPVASLRVHTGGYRRLRMLLRIRLARRERVRLCLWLCWLLFVVIRVKQRDNGFGSAWRSWLQRARLCRFWHSSGAHGLGWDLTGRLQRRGRCYAGRRCWSMCWARRLQCAPVVLRKVVRASAWRPLPVLHTLRLRPSRVLVLHRRPRLRLLKRMRVLRRHWLLIDCMRRSVVVMMVATGVHRLSWRCAHGLRRSMMR